MNRKLNLLALGVAAALGGCTSGNTAVPPPARTVNPITSNTLQFAVGTANIGGTTGLNTVVTFRQPNGFDGTLLNTPTIVGPPGFVNTGSAAAAGNDAGTNQISGTPQANPLGSPTAPSTFGTSGGAFAYGFQPANSTTGGAVTFSRYSLPFFAPKGFTAVPFIGGPPAYPNVRNGTEPTNPNTGAPFQGFPLGFTDFGVTPVAGQYTLTLNIPTGFTSAGVPTSGTVSATATLTALAALPTFGKPAFTPNLDKDGNGTGGGTVTVTVPAGVTEALIIVVDRDATCYPGGEAGSPAYYTFKTTTTGPQTFALPDNLGPTFGPQTSTPSICSGKHNTDLARKTDPKAPPQPGDTYRVYAVGADYPLFEAGPPGNTSQAPAITGANGQSDITQSAVLNGAAPDYVPPKPPPGM